MSKESLVSGKRDMVAERGGGFGATRSIKGERKLVPEGDILATLHEPFCKIDLCCKVVCNMAGVGAR